ncbi:hypothetical protein Y032_0675g1420 [Ancylostoma ceylanicum]|uniref:Uncharacterized protein n=1 Tax=Ancylostoma ceylanicum TaxID=53326 RepID=A0A016WJD9_9BILA|nr:hypothetical protein Y032_0675g1420 [Ancylostoma ceylanicum]
MRVVLKLSHVMLAIANYDESARAFPPRRIRVLAFPPLLGQGGPVAWRLPLSLSKYLYRDVCTTDQGKEDERHTTGQGKANEQPAGHRDGCERTRHSLKSPLQIVVLCEWVGGVLFCSVYCTA